MKELNFISSNLDKAKYLSDYFDISVKHRHLELDEIQSLDLKEVVLKKAKEAYRKIYEPVLVEDTSLVFKELGKLPGPLIKWFRKELDDEGLCHMLNHYPTREATAMVAYGYCDGKEAKAFIGEVEGTIARAPKGENGFGWDPIFIPKGYLKTWAEMTDDEKAETSMRKIALEKLREFLMSF